MKIENNIKKIYLYHFFRSFIWAYVIERLFWASRGMTITSTVYMEFLYAFLIIALEIPSGLWADRFSRKSVMVVGSLFNVLCYCVLFVAYGPVMFGLSIALSAVNGALSSGSINALAYDTLIALDRVSHFHRYLSNVNIIKYASGFAAALLGAYFATQNGLLFPYKVSFVSVILSLLMALSLVEPQKQAVKEAIDEDIDEESTPSFMTLVRFTVETLRSNVFLRRIMLIAGAVCATIVYVEEFWQNYFLETGLNPSYFGIISGLMSLSVIVAAHFTPNVITRLDQSKEMASRKYSLLMLLMALLLGGIGWTKHLYAVGFMCLASGVNALGSNMILADIHHKVDSKNRATMESVFSVIERSFVILSGLIFGFVSDHYSVFTGFIAIALFLLVVYGLAIALARKTAEPIAPRC